MARLEITSLLFASALVASAGHAADPVFSAVGGMTTPRQEHTASLLPTGKVLIIGGQNAGSLTAADLYDPVTGAFAATAPLAHSRSLHTATVMRNGKVLVAGGFDSSSLLSAELFDPATSTFATAGNLRGARCQHTATLLRDGNVLIVGGRNGAALNTAELYNPADGTFTSTGNLNTARFGHTATLLPNGKILVAGGSDGNSALQSAELYDPTERTFTATGNLVAARRNFTATLLRGGAVLIAGGESDTALSSAELYDAGTGTFSATASLASARSAHTATLLPSGKVLITGGATGTALSSAELYDPATPAFSTAGNLGAARSLHTATLLTGGSVLIAGGSGNEPLASAELFVDLRASFTRSGDLITGRAWGHTATPLLSGKVLIAGGISPGPSYSVLASAELYDPATGTVTQTGSLRTPRHYHRATLLPDGKVLMTGGDNGVPRDGTHLYLSSAELYDPVTGTFTQTGSMASARVGHTATVLANGKVLVAGGYNGGYVPWGEVFDPAAGTFSPTGNLITPRQSHTATLLADRKVLIAGGIGGSLYEISSAELYDPDAASFRPTGNLVTGRRNHTSTLLGNGTVLLAGGRSYHLETQSYQALASLESYNPSTGTFTTIGELTAGRDMATMLSSGDIFFFGGSSGGIFNPATRRVVASGTTLFRRTTPAAALLPSGRILIVGGILTSDDPGVNSTEVMNAAAFADDDRPRITAAPTSITLPEALTLNGSGFYAPSEGSSGGTNASPANSPVLQLERIDNGPITAIVPSSMADDTWSGPLTHLFTGAYRLLVVTNGIPSEQRPLQIVQVFPSIASVSPAFGLVSGGDTVTITGENLLGVSVTIGNVPATVSGTTDTTATVTTPPHESGVVDVTVTNPGGGSFTATGAYTYVTAVPPTDVRATASTATSVQVTWTAARDATEYQVMRSSDGQAYTPVGTTSLTEWTDSTASAGMSYLYTVHVTAPAVSGAAPPDVATTVMFTDDPTIAGSTPIKAAHLLELREAVTAIRALGGLTTPAFTTDTTITPGTTRFKAAHITELRSALDAARSSLSLPRITYWRTDVGPGLTIFAHDVNDLRNGVK